MHCISISHKTTPVNIREQFAFSEEEQLEFQRHLLKQDQILGCVIVSTCNRCEIYFSGDKSTIHIVERELKDYKHLHSIDIKKYLNIYSNEGAIRHLFRVSSGLDSMVLGEDEILHQVKAAYHLSLQHECTDTELNLAFQGAIGNAKHIKTDTRISSTPVSIGTLTANHIADYAKTLNNVTILIIGITGKMGSIVAKNLCDKGNLKIIGSSRRNCNTGFLTNHKIQIIEYKDRYQYLKEADVIVSATTSPHYTFTYQDTAKELVGNIHSKLFIDLAVPSDIDQDIQSIPGVEILDIDDFEKLSKDNSMVKHKEIGKAETILEHFVEETLKDIYFQQFHGKMDQILEKIEANGIKHMLYQLKKTSNSEHFRIILDALEEVSRGDS